MALLYISEFSQTGAEKSGGEVMAPLCPADVEQAVAVGGASVASTAFVANTRYVMLHTDTTCCLAFGATPTALAGFHRMAANETRFYGVVAGQKVAVIQSP